MLSRSLVSLAAILLLVAAISQAEGESSNDPFVGTYDVSGVTTDIRSGDTRKLEGHIVLSKSGAEYRAASQLATDYPTAGGSVHADVVGTGEARLEGGVLKGNSRTQLVLQKVPGVDTNFAFVPREVGPRIVSTWTARLEKDGTLVVDLANRPAKGEQYSATTTKLRGTRVVMPQEEAPKHGP